MLTLIFAVLSSAGRADEYLDSTKAENLRVIQQLAFNDRYALADSVCRSMIEHEPNDPAGYLFRAIAMMAHMSDAEENLYPVEFGAMLDSAERLSRARLQHASGREGAWMCLFRGHCRSYRALWEARFGSKIKALKLGLNARSFYKQGFEYDSSLTDLHFGLGLYHYWKSVRAGVLKFFGIFNDDKDEGIEQLYIASESSVISRDAAYSSLVWVWVEEKKPDSAIAIAHEVFAKFPDGKSLFWPLAEAYLQQENYEQAVATYYQLRERLILNPGNFYNLIECEFQLVETLGKLGLDDEATLVARQAQRYSPDIPDNTRKRQHDKIKKLKKLAGH